jgi:hypothetical protein
MRRRSRILLLAALVALLPWIVFRLILPDDGPDDGGGAVERDAVPESPDPSLRGHAVGLPPASELPDPVATPKPATIRIRVTRQEDGTPVPGAEVALCRANALERSHGVVLAADVEERAATDDAGVAVLPRPPASDTAYVLRARAAGHVAGRLPWVGADEVGLALAVGSSLGGTVVDAEGRPVEDCTVTATALGAPAAIWNRPLLPWTSACTEAVTDRLGRFRLGGLHAALRYQLGVRQRGWRLRPARMLRRDRRATVGEVNAQTLVEAGVEDARLVVERIAVLSLCFRDEAGRRHLAPPPAELSLALLDGAPWVTPGEIDPNEGTFFDGEAWWGPPLPILPEWPDDIVYSFVLPVRRDAPLPLRVRLRYEMFDRLRGTARVELREPPAARKHGNRDAITVPVGEPGDSSVGTARILASETDRAPSCEEAGWAEPPPLLFLWPEGQALVQVRGLLFHRSHWLFENLPPGRADVALARGGLVGATRRVDLRPGESLGISLSSPTRTGVRLRAEDAQGRLVFGLDHLAFTDRSTSRPALSLDPRLGDPRWDPAANELLPPVLAVPSGTWTVSVHKEGLGWASGEVRMAGEVTDVTVRFR